MTEDFARDMQLLQDLLQLASDRGFTEDEDYAGLNTLFSTLNQQAGALMEAAGSLKRSFNEKNRELMMGLWITTFVDPVDPPFGEPVEVEAEATEETLISRAKTTGGLVIGLLDLLKAPHEAKNDGQPQGEDLKNQINKVRDLVPADLVANYSWLNRRLDAMIRAFSKDGGAGDSSTYWPSNYGSSSSSSSSSSSYP